MSPFTHRSFLIQYWYPLAMVVLFSGIGLSWHYFPGGFDWRYQTLSDLVARSKNPEGYRYYCFTLVLTPLFLFPLCRYLRRSLEPYSSRTALFSFYTLQIGLAMTLIVGVERLLLTTLSDVIHKGHEYLAIIAFGGLFLGVVGFWLALVQTFQIKKSWSPAMLALVTLCTASPLLGAALSQAYLYIVPNDLGWVGPHWAALGVPLYLSFAFWEWLASLAVWIYLYAILLLAPAPIADRVPNESPRSAEYPSKRAF